MTDDAMKLLEEARDTLAHGMVFFKSREKMHETGVQLAQDLRDRIDRYLATGGWVECSPAGARRNAIYLPNIAAHICTEHKGKWYARQPLPPLAKKG
jgi:hypothetical protein